MTKQQPAIDLSSLPPAIRQQIEAGLAKLPPEARRELLEKGSPMLEKAIARAKAKTATAQAAMVHGSGAHSGPHTVAAREYRGHYNGTIRPGDRLDIRGWMVGAALVIGVVWWWMK